MTRPFLLPTQTPHLLMPAASSIPRFSAPGPSGHRRQEAVQTDWESEVSCQRPDRVEAGCTPSLRAAVRIPPNERSTSETPFVNAPPDAAQPSTKDTLHREPPLTEA